MDNRLLRALRLEPRNEAEDAPPTGVLTLEAPPGALGGGGQSPPPFGLDPTGDFDLSVLEVEHVRALEEALTEDPDTVLASAAQFWDGDITEGQLRGALEKTRLFLEKPAEASLVLESSFALESTVGMPPGWGFEGYDPVRLPISPMDTRFETTADAVGYATTWLAAKVANAFKSKPAFPRHTPERSFVYDFPAAKTTLGVLGDFGNGLAHARYIAKHLRASHLDHLLYLGDVYYAGTSKEFAAHVGPEMEPFLTGSVAGGKKVNVMMLNSNHEMFSKGHSYYSYLRYRLAKGAPQCQEGSYFALRFGDAFQIIAVDTDYFGYRKFRDPGQMTWLRQRLAEGRSRGALNVLLTANEPFEYGQTGHTELSGDLKSFLPGVDLWLWGNTHYGALFDRTEKMPVSGCLGHGGYPYKLSEQKLDKNPYLAPSPATPLFLETRSRYDGTNLRPELGNNGYALMTLEPGAGPAQHRLRLDFMDWMKRPRYRAVVGRDGNGRFGVLEGVEV